MYIDKLYYFLKHFHGNGLILWIDSPGGGPEAYKIVEALQNLSVPSVCYIHYYGTSAAYWICSQADKVVAEPFAIVGSIGGIVVYLSFYGFLKKLGIEPVVIRVGKYKDILNPFSNITPQEKEIIKKKLEVLVNIFRRDVLRKRKIKNVTLALSGQWFFGITAKKIGLVDYLGDLDTAKKIIAKMLNTSVNNINFITVSFDKNNLISEILGEFLIPSFLLV
jgi:protease-4